VYTPSELARLKQFIEDSKKLKDRYGKLERGE
jgi:hypothetical protein